MPNRHAKVSDLPGWPCPPRVRDIPTTPDSWGWIGVGDALHPIPVAVDELGYLWVRADVAPRYRLPADADVNPGAIVFWTPDGIGLHLHPKSYQWLPSTSRLDHNPDEWLAVAEVSKTLPSWIEQ
jgi:hypothetical protein